MQNPLGLLSPTYLVHDRVGEVVQHGRIHGRPQGVLEGLFDLALGRHCVV